ncbi:MAG: hypothetical protein H0T89_29790 [Deltaproteobacteria bacterium]|nr:hypothetical protein [Deltaproteobacteria bacterium]MDQ3297847.1 hypothetical protein [Myxococcota bacterium]
MLDARWTELKERLIDNGWVWREDTLYAPHETMWFQTSSDNPDFAQFRDRMTIARDATSGNLDLDIDQAALHEDLVSLVAALDDVLAPAN